MRTFSRLLFLALALLQVALAAQEQVTDADNPFRTAKVGDWVEWKTTTRTPAPNPDTPPITSQSHIKETVKNVGRDLLEMQVEIMGQQDPVFMAIQYPLNRPFRPEWMGQQGKVEQTAEPKSDTLEIAGKKQECSKRELKLTTADGVATLKLWTLSEIPFGGIARMELTSSNGTVTIREAANFGTAAK
jgi:hypothetical protein